MYRRLPHGPHGLDREDVARHQRARLYGGMIQSIAQRGYAKTTVAHVIGLAGVSRRAFYEQFANKEECFLATYDIVIARSRKLTLEAWGCERGWANRLHASCKAFLDDIVADPKGAHLVLIDALGIGSKARERMLLAGAAYELLVTRAFKLSPNRVPLPTVAPRAIVGGVRHVVFNRVREDRVGELRTMTDELLDWVEAYRSPLAARLSATALKKPPEIPPAPAAFLAHDDRRARVLGSVVHLTLDEGYRELTDPQIAQFAGISTEAFHKQFASKEECFLTVIDEFAAEALQVVEARIAQISSWEESVPVAVNAFVEHLVSHPALLRMAFVDLFDVGPGMVSRLTKAIDRFTGMLHERGPAPRRAPEIAAEAVTGAIWEVVGHYSSAERMRYLPCLSDHISFLTLAPYVGPKTAVESIERTRRDVARLRRSQLAAARLAAPPQSQPDAPAVLAAGRTVTELPSARVRKAPAKASAGSRAQSKAAAGKGAGGPAKAGAGRGSTGARSQARAAGRRAGEPSPGESPPAGAPTGASDATGPEDSDSSSRPCREASKRDPR